MRVLGLSTTVMDPAYPRYSTSEALLETALASARERGAETQLIRLSQLKFRPCEGYYSKSAHACTWPCSITQMDPTTSSTRSTRGSSTGRTPCSWPPRSAGDAASSLYYKMVERMNCVQNQVTVRNRILLRNKTAAFIITGGQDNVQAVAGQMLGFFAEVGCVFPQFPYIAHSRGWTAEDMERNVAFVQQSQALHEAARELAGRAIDMARILLTTPYEGERIARAGRKGCQGTAPESPAMAAAQVEG